MSVFHIKLESLHDVKIKNLLNLSSEAHNLFSSILDSGVPPVVLGDMAILKAGEGEGEEEEEEQIVERHVKFPMFEK